MAFGKILGLDLFSPQSTQNSNVVNTSTSNQYQSTQNSTYSPTNTYTDSRQLILVLNSPGSTTTTKKADAASTASNPSLSSNPLMTNTPTLTASNTPTSSVGQPSLLGGLFGDGSNLLIIGGVVLLGVVLLSGGKK